MSALVGGVTYDPSGDGGYWTDTPPASSSDLGAIQTPNNPYMFTLAGVQNAAGSPGASYNGIPASQVLAAMQNGATADQAMTPYQPTLYGSATQTGGGTTVVSTPPVTQQATQNNVQVKNNTVNPSWVTPSQALAPQQMIQIGGRSYPASSVIAQAAPIAGPSFGGSFQSMQPVMDTNGSAAPPVYNLGSQGGQTQLAAPDISGYMPTPYENGPPQAPQNNPYMPSPAMMAAQQAVGFQPPMAMGGNPAQFAPGGSPYGNPYAAGGMAQGPQLFGRDAMGVPYLPQGRQKQPGVMGAIGGALHRLADATPEGQRLQAARVAFGYNRQQADAQRDAMLKQALIPSMMNAETAQMNQANENYRNAANNYAHGSEAVLQSMLRTKESQTTTAEQAFKAAADAMMMPAMIQNPATGQMIQNPFKSQANAQAASVFGWNPQQVAQLSQVQDPKAAEQYQQAIIETKTKQFAYKSAVEKLGYEIQNLKAQAAQLYGSTSNLQAQARAQNFETDQNQKVAVYERMGKVAQGVGAVLALSVNQQTKDARINAVNAGAVEAQAKALAAQYTANGMPAKYATDMAKAKAALLATMDKSTAPLAEVLDDAIYTTLGIKNRPVTVTDPQTQSQSQKMIPVNAPPALQYMGDPRQAFRGNPQMMGGFSNATPTIGLR